MSARSRKKGFSLVELLAVITLISVLAGISYVVYSGIVAKTRDIRRKSDLYAVQTAVDAYYIQYGKYPGPGTCSHKSPSWINWSNCGDGKWDDDSADIVAVLESGGYIKKMPKDPKNKGGPPDDFRGEENFNYGYRAWPEGNDATYYLCTNLETEVGTVQYRGYNYCVRGGCLSCH